MTTVTLSVNGIELLSKECDNEELGSLVAQFTREDEDPRELQVPKFSRRTMQPQVEEAVAPEL